MNSEMCPTNPTNLEVLARIGTAEEPRVPTLTSDASFSETPGNKRLLQRLLQDCQPAICEGSSPRPPSLSVFQMLNKHHRKGPGCNSVAECLFLGLVF